MSNEKTPPLLSLNGLLYIRAVPDGEFLRVPMYGGFWELVHEVRYVQLCQNMDNLNPNEYIDSQSMSVVWTSLCLYHYEQWDQVGKKTEEEKLACFNTAILMPTDAATVNRLRQYWEGKKRRFGITEDLADRIDPVSLSAYSYYRQNSH